MTVGNLRIGTHRYRVAADGYHPWDGTITIARGQDKRVSVVLERARPAEQRALPPVRPAAQPGSPSVAPPSPHRRLPPHWHRPRSERVPDGTATRPVSPPRATPR